MSLDDPTIAEVIEQHPENWALITVEYGGQRQGHWVELAAIEDSPAIAYFVQTTLQQLGGPDLRPKPKDNE